MDLYSTSRWRSINSENLLANSVLELYKIEVYGNGKSTVKNRPILAIHFQLASTFATSRRAGRVHEAIS